MNFPSQARDSIHLPLVDRHLVQTCHIQIPGEPKPVSAIAYDNRLYSYVRFYSDLDSALRGAERLIARGNRTVLTRVPKGLVLWVFEADAQVA